MAEPATTGGHSAVPARALNGDGHIVRGRHGRTIAKNQLALRVARHVVHAKHGVTRKLREQAVFHHLFGAAQAFFSRLKNQVNGAGKRGFLGDVFGRSQQHGGVSVVAAGVHDAGVAAGVRQARGFVDRQGVHVGADADAFAACAFLELAHHAGAPQSACHVVTPSRQLLGHQVAGAVLLVAHLRVLVDVAAHRDEFIRLGLQGLEFVVQESVGRGVHGGSSSITGLAD